MLVTISERMQELTRSGGLSGRAVHKNDHAEAIAAGRLAVDRAVVIYMVNAAFLIILQFEDSLMSNSQL